jgi:hypothetical protein
MRCEAGMLECKSYAAGVLMLLAVLVEAFRP